MAPTSFASDAASASSADGTCGHAGEQQRRCGFGNDRNTAQTARVTRAASGEERRPLDRDVGIDDSVVVHVDLAVVVEVAVEPPGDAGQDDAGIDVAIVV